MSLGNETEPLTEQQVAMRADLTTYVGKNVGEYNRLISRYADETPEKPIEFRVSYALTGFFVPTFWLLYRKMYLAALCVFCAQFAIATMVPGPWSMLIVGTITMLGGKTYYIRRAVRDIHAIRATTSSPERAKELIAAQGGTHTWVWLIGLLIFGSVFVIGALTLLGSNMHAH